MRACSFCRIYNFLCVIAPESFYCERCFRSYLEYELAPPDVKVERLFKEEERLASEIAAVYAKASRLRKQYRNVMKKLRDLGSREDRNILNLKIDELIAEKALPGSFNASLEVFNSPSPRFFSFFNPALLDFPDRIVKVPQNNS
jgi:hypothetical protein